MYYAFYITPMIIVLALTALTTYYSIANKDVSLIGPIIAFSAAAVIPVVNIFAIILLAYGAIDEFVKHKIDNT